MKLAVLVLMTVAGTAGALAMPTSIAWVRPHDARPEALIIGAGLLVLASVLRHRSPHSDTK